jgi:hypothetical protein
MKLFAVASGRFSRRGRPPAWLAALLMGCLAAGVAWADEPEAEEFPPSRPRAEELVFSGDRLVEQVDYAGALEKYTLAYHTLVSEIRGQKFRKRVLPSLMNRQELGQEMLRQMDKEYTAEELELIDGSYKALGMMPRELYTRELMTKLLTEEVAGFYDPENKRMVLILEDGPDKDPGFLGRLLGIRPAFDKQEQKTTLAHEMTHALQDQLYDLLAMQKAIEKDDDMLMAFSGLVEGDASLLMFVADEPGSDVTDMDVEEMRSMFRLMTWAMPVAGGKTYRQAPPIFRESLMFPYLQGMLFAMSVAKDGGWEGVHRAYQRPPTSTEQILHPEKYLDEAQRDEPQRVILPDLKSAVDGQWRHLGGNCLGEFQTAVMLRNVRGGKRAADGWDGDRYEIFAREDGTLALAMVSVWDSETDAEEFATAYHLYRNPPPPRRRSGAQTSRAAANDPNQPAADNQQPDETQPPEKQAEEKQAEEKQLTSGGFPFARDAARLIQQRGDKVFIVEGFSESESTAILEQLREARFEPKAFSMPANRDVP